MKSICIFLLIIIPHAKVFSQKLAFIKPGLESVNGYDSTKKNIIITIDKETYFMCGDINKNWASLINMAGIDDGIICKDSIIFFNDLSINKQRQRINAVLSKFYSIYSMSNVAIIDTFNNKVDTTYLPPWESYYEKTFYPIFCEFQNYYKKTKDTVTLLNILKAGNCNPDGEFGVTFDYLIGTCYNLDKKLFVRQIRRIRNKEQKESAKFYLLNSGIPVYYTIKYRQMNKPEAEIKKLINKEKFTVAKLLK